jgi:hypothetical protein
MSEVGYPLIATHLEESNHLPNQKQAAVNKYDFTVFTTLVQGSETCGILERFQWIHWIALTTVIQDFQCTFTYWALVEMPLP